jgi:hypothetical protein
MGALLAFAIFVLCVLLLTLLTLFWAALTLAALVLSTLILSTLILVRHRTPFSMIVTLCRLKHSHVVRLSDAESC